MIGWDTAPTWNVLDNEVGFPRDIFSEELGYGTGLTIDPAPRIKGHDQSDRFALKLGLGLNVPWSDDYSDDRDHYGNN